MKNTRTLIISSLLIFYLLQLSFFCLFITVNITHSLPEGFYIRSFQHRPDYGTYVRFKPPIKHSQLGTSTLLKQVAGLPGDHLVVSPAGIWLNGQSLGTVQQRDSQGKLLPCFQYSGIIPAGSVFVLGMTDDSFDSRYFGLISLDALSTYKPLLIFH